jgi:hypothetical protein
MGMLLSRKRRGACEALTWDEAGSAYRCGVLSDPDRWLPGLGAPLKGWAQALARRWIAAGAGCDSDLLADPPSQGAAADRTPA